MFMVNEITVEKVSFIHRLFHECKVWLERHVFRPRLEASTMLHPAAENIAAGSAASTVPALGIAAGSNGWAGKNGSGVGSRNNVRILGPADGPVLVLVQGFGCDQIIWDRLLPFLEDSYRVVLFDHVGTGGADIAAYDPDKYFSLAGYTDDLAEVLAALDLQDVTIVGHTVGGMMAIAAVAAGNTRIRQMILFGTSACYAEVPEDDYHGGFTPTDIDEILAAVEANHPLWAATTAPALIGRSTPSELSSQVAERLCQLHPDYVRDFLRMSLQADVRQILPEVSVPVLILQSAADPLTPASCYRYLFEHLPHSALIHLNAKGNMPHVNAPAETAQAIRQYVPRSSHAAG